MMIIPFCIFIRSTLTINSTLWREYFYCLFGFRTWNESGTTIALYKELIESKDIKIFPWFDFYKIIQKYNTIL